MKIRVLAMFLLIILTGCNSSIDYNELVAENQVLKEENKRLISELESGDAKAIALVNQYDEELKAVQSELEEYELMYNTLENEIKITEDEEMMIDFYNNSSLTMYHGLSNSQVKIKVELNEPLRALPSSKSPYYNRKLTYTTSDDFGNEFQKGIFEGELLYITSDVGDHHKSWCLIIVEDTIGYVPEDCIVEYTNAEYSYDTKESLVGLELGMTVDQIEELFPNSFKHINNKSDYVRFMKIEKEGKGYLSALYNPNTRIVDSYVIKTEDIPLSSGLKVGDEIQKVFEYYDKLFELVNLDYDFGDQHRIYDIGNGYWLVIEGEDGVVKFITLTPGYINAF